MSSWFRRTFCFGVGAGSKPKTETAKKEVPVIPNVIPPTPRTVPVTIPDSMYNEPADRIVYYTNSEFPRSAAQSPRNSGDYSPTMYNNNNRRNGTSSRNRGGTDDHTSSSFGLGGFGTGIGAMYLASGSGFGGGGYGGGCDTGGSGFGDSGGGSFGGDCGGGGGGGFGGGGD